MSMNEGRSSQPKFMQVNVGNTTTVKGQPVRLGQVVGVAQTNSDGGVTSGHGPLTPLAGEATKSSKYNIPNWCAVAISGEHKLSVTMTAARGQFDPVYIKPDGTLTDIPNGTTNFLFGALSVAYTGGAATVSVFVFIACSLA